MEVTVKLPDEVADKLGSESEMPQRVLEAVVIDAYLSGKLSQRQVGAALGLDYWQTEDGASRRLQPVPRCASFAPA